MIGLNLTDIDTYQNALYAITALKAYGETMTRVVVDNGRSLVDYQQPILDLSKITKVMVQIQDSYGDAKISTSALYNKAEILWGLVNTVPYCWEIGNETNGDWLSTKAWQRVQFLSNFFGQKKARRVLTVFVQDDYLDWIQDYKIPCEFLFLSHYPGSKRDLLVNWESAFKEIGLVYPKAQVGFGEFGSENWKGATLQTKIDLIQYYYGMRLKNKAYIGGGFFWDFQSEVLPTTSVFYTALNETLRRRYK